MLWWLAQQGGPRFESICAQALLCGGGIRVCCVPAFPAAVQNIHLVGSGSLVILNCPQE